MEHENVVVMSPQYTKAMQLDRHIKVHAQMAQASLYEVCKGLKEMRDGKLYAELGYQNFAEYCENEVGIKRRQAYNYISVAEKLSENFVQSTAQIGTEKLFLLAKLSDSDREQIQQEADIESTTVKELQEKIKGLKRQHSTELDDQKDQYEKKLQELEQERENISVKYQFDKQAHRRELDEAKKKSESLAVHITELERQIQELENRPVEVMQSTAELEEIERLKFELQETKSREKEAKAEAERMQSANAETTNEVKRLQTRISELENQSVPEAEPDVKELFRPYFQACTHSIGLMMNFINKQKESPDFAFLTSKASQIAQVIESQLQDLKNQSE